MLATLSTVTVSTQLDLDISWPSPLTSRVAAVGEVDLATAHLLRARLLGLLREHRPAVIDVDLAGVTFLDCTGISALVAVRNAAVRAGREFRVSHPQPIVSRVLELTGLLDVFTAGSTRRSPYPPDPAVGSPSTTSATRSTALNQR